MASQALVERGESVALQVFGEDYAAIKQGIAPDLTDVELDYLASVSRSMGLSVLRKQIYGVKRKTRKQIGGSWRDVDSLVIQVGIDGYRVIAERTGKYAGQLGPFWCAEDGKWQDVWLSDSPPAAAKVGVIRKDFSEPLWAVATYTSYAAIYDGKPQNLWARMPDVMLAKCAESLALRKAFPDEIGGTYTDEEMQQADNPPALREVARELPPHAAQRAPAAAPPPSSLPVTRNKERALKAALAPAESGKIEWSTDKQIAAIHIRRDELGMTEEVYRKLLLERYSNCVEPESGKPSSTQLTIDEASDFIEYLHELYVETQNAATE